MPLSNLSTRDQKVLWHPYTQHGSADPALPILSSKGAYLQLEYGQKILDGISSWWVNLHGHNHPRIVQAIQQQCETLAHTLFAGFTHAPAIELAEHLILGANQAGGDFSKVFFSDNGSTAVEVALKLALQFQANRSNTKRTRFLALQGGFHGDTFGAMAVGDANGFHANFKSLLPFVDTLSPGNLAQAEKLLHSPDTPYAAFIFEPTVQGAAGMQAVDPAFLREMIELCQRQQILTIADEVFTGFFRTGKCFAFEHSSIKPDFLCLSKGITGGFLPLGATLTREEIYAAFLSPKIERAFLHGHSYTANPLACAAALESWKLLHEPATQQQIRDITRWTSLQVSKLKENPKIKAARTFGTIGAVEMASNRNYFSGGNYRILARSLKLGVLLRPLGNVLYAVPPYCCTEEEIHHIYQTVGTLTEEFTDELE